MKQDIASRDRKREMGKMEK